MPIEHISQGWWGVLRITSDRDDRMVAKIKIQKNRSCFKQNSKNPWTKIQPPKNPMPNFRAMKILERRDCRRTILVLLYSRNYAAGRTRELSRSSDCFEYPNKSLLKPSYPKKNLPKNFPTQKNPKIENFKHKKFVRSSLSLEYPPPPGTFPLMPAFWMSLQYTPMSYSLRHSQSEICGGQRP